MVLLLSFRDITNSYKLDVSPELTTDPSRESSPLLSISSTTREFSSMENLSKDKSSPSADYNSPAKLSRLVVEPELENLELQFLKKMLPRSLLKALLVDHLPDNKEDKI